MKIKFFCVLAVFLFSLVPMLYIARYSHPNADDFSYGNIVINTWRETGSLRQTISAAVNGTKTVYNSWQGTFSAVFLMILQPAIFGAQFYMFGSVLLILAFIVSTVLFLKVVLMDYFKADFYSFGIIAAVFTLISMQFLISPVEAFYWYNSGVFYVGFHSAALVLWSLILLSFKSNKKIFVVIVPVLAFFVVGGNFITALSSAIVMFFILIYGIRIKKFIVPTVGLIAICSALVLSVLSPGNDVRQSHYQGMNPIESVIMSFVYAVGYIITFVPLPVFFALCALTPLVLIIVKNSAFNFPLPCAATFLFFCIFASAFTPTLYAWGIVGSERVLNLIHFKFLFFALFTIIYWCGWCCRKFKFSLENYIFEFFTFCFIVSCVFFSLSNINLITSVSAARSVFTGEAKTFHNQNMARLIHLNNSNIKDIELFSLTARPYVLYFSDITPNADDWLNIGITEYYNKRSVVTIENAVEINIKVNNELIIFNTQRPFVADGKFFVPVREVFEALGFNVIWNEGSITLSNTEHIAVITIGNENFTVNGKNHALQSPMRIINGSSVMPITNVLDSLGIKFYGSGYKIDIVSEN